MKIYNKSKGFTLAEMMIVLLILTIIFAAFAPLMTKKQKMSTRSRYQVWSWKDYTTMDAKFDPGNKDFSGQLFFGLTPESQPIIEELLNPASKIVIRSGGVTSADTIQRQMQFRYGRNSRNDKGQFAGTWFLDGKNVLLGGEYRFGNVKSNKIEAKNNVGIGYFALNNVKDGKYNTALGYYTLPRNVSGNYNTALGYMAGKNIDGKNDNTFIGSNAGLSNTGSKNTMIGYNAGWRNTGNSNLFVGSYSGGGSTNTTGNGNYNVAIGYNALGNLTSGSYNVAVGYNALKNLTTGGYNVAIGANACSQVTTGSKKTCIGYNSGPKSNLEDPAIRKDLRLGAGNKQIQNMSKTTSENFLNATTDDVSRTYIGSTPYYYGGDAVLEIHNPGTTSKGIKEVLGKFGDKWNNSTVGANTTTVINGNLIVRGQTYFTRSGILSAWKSYDVSSSGIERGVNISDECNNNAQKSYNMNSGCIRLFSSTTSDRRLKNIGSKNSAGLNEINKLKVFNFTFKNDDAKRPQVGVMAQDLQKVFPNSVFKGPDGYLRIRWDEMFYAAINAIKELDSKLTALVRRTTNIETQIAKLENQNSQLKAEVLSLTNRVEKLKIK